MSTNWWHASRLTLFGRGWEIGHGKEESCCGGKLEMKRARKPIGFGTLRTPLADPTSPLGPTPTSFPSWKAEPFPLTVNHPQTLILLSLSLSLSSEYPLFGSLIFILPSDCGKASSWSRSPELNHPSYHQTVLPSGRSSYRTNKMLPRVTNDALVILIFSVFTFLSSLLKL